MRIRAAEVHGFSLIATLCGPDGNGSAPSDERDGESYELDDEDERDAGGPLAECPECSGNHAGRGAAEIVAGDVEAGGGDARSRRGGFAKVARRGCLCNEDSAGKHGESANDDGQRRTEREQYAGDGGGDGCGDARAQADSRDEISGAGSYHEADEVDEEERAQGGGGKRKRLGAEVESDPGEGADKREEHIEAHGKRGNESAVAEEALHLIEERR